LFFMPIMVSFTVFTFFFSDFQLFRPDHHWWDFISWNAHLVHQHWYRVCFTYYHCLDHDWQTLYRWIKLGPRGIVVRASGAMIQTDDPCVGSSNPTVGRECRSFGWDRSRCDTIKIPPSSKALSTEHRPKFAALSPAMVIATR
jgi:hypothetical protein